MSPQGPGQNLFGCSKRDGAVIKASRCGDHTAAVADRIQECREDASLGEQALSMDRHLHSVRIGWITPGRHETQLVDTEIGAKPGNTSHIQGTGRFHQHHGQRCRNGHGSMLNVLRWARRSAIS